MDGIPNEPMNLRVANLGGQTLNLNASDININGPDAANFSFDSSVLPIALQSGQHIYIPVSVAGTEEGRLSATMYLTCNGAVSEVQLAAEIMHPGANIIGHGNDCSSMPFACYAESEYYATLYTADEIDNSGLITAIAWYCAHISLDEIPYKIWAKNTTADTMTLEPWDDFAADLTLLKEGTHIPCLPGWQTFHLETPFSYTGGNLIIAVGNDGEDYIWGSPHQFSCTEHDEVRTQYWWLFEDSNTDQGSLSPKAPNIMLHFATPNDGAQLPTATTALHGNYPNPFNPETTISYSVMKPGRVKLEVYNLKGQLVKTLVNEDHAAGEYRQVFNAKDEKGSSLASGVYLVRMHAPGYRKTSKMVLMK
jgi:hypothetical protein